MKKYFIILYISICAFADAYPQSYNLFPEYDTYWLMEYIDGFGQHDKYDYFHLSQLPNDTLISGQVYHKLLQGPSNNYVGGVRQNVQARTVFFFPADSVKEYMLFDFSKNVGDTVYNIYCKHIFDWKSNTYNGIIDNIDSLLINGIYYRRFSITNFQNGWGAIWIEKIGGYGGIINNAPFGSVSGGEHLVCMSSNSIRYYPSYKLGGCQLNIGLTESLKIPSKISVDVIYNRLVVKQDIGEESVRLFMYDSMGKLCMNKSFSS
jgi:hypothetical protein